MTFAADKEAPAIRAFLSPDGKRVAYGEVLVGPDGYRTSRLVIRSVDGSARQEIRTNLDSFGEVLWRGSERVLYSPDFFSSPPSPAYWEVTSQGKLVETTKLPPGCEVGGQRLSPDGKSLAFRGKHKRPGAETFHGLFVVTLADGNVRQLLQETAMSPPAWSPDGKKLAIGIGAYQKEYALAVIDVASGRVERLGCDGVGADWSPNGKFLAFTTQNARGGSWRDGIPVDGRIGVWDLEKKTLTHVSAPGKHTDEEIAGSLHPRWSSDGNWLAYERQRTVTATGPTLEARET